MLVIGVFLFGVFGPDATGPADVSKLGSETTPLFLQGVRWHLSATKRGD